MECGGVRGAGKLDSAGGRAGDASCALRNVVTKISYDGQTSPSDFGYQRTRTELAEHCSGAYQRHIGRRLKCSGQRVVGVFSTGRKPCHKKKQAGPLPGAQEVLCGGR